MKIVNEMPQNGAFVMVWEWEDALYSDSFKYIDGVLYVWDIPDMDISPEWIKAIIECYRLVFESCNYKFIVKEI